MIAYYSGTIDLLPPHAAGGMQRRNRLCVVCRTAALVALSISMTGCAGYQIGARSLYPAHIQTVYVPMFESDSFRRNLGEQLTEAVMKEIELKTPYKVVGTPNADSILSGRITDETKRIVVGDRSGLPREIEVNLQVQVRWIDHHGDTVQPMCPLPMDSVRIPPEMTVASSATLIPEVGQSVATAQQTAIQELAAQIVGLMENPW